MSVLIKGMKIPKNCAECLLLVNACSEEFPSYVCDVTGDDVLSIYENPDWCPLVEIPTPHGDLIDRDAVNQEYNKLGWWEDSDESVTSPMQDILFDAPAIIEADKEGNYGKYSM